MKKLTPAAVLANAKSKKKVSKKELHKAAQILGSLGGYKRAYLHKLKELSRIGKYGAAIRWDHINKETTPFATYDLPPVLLTVKPTKPTK